MKSCVGFSQCELDELLKVCDDVFSEQPWKVNARLN